MPGKLITTGDGSKLLKERYGAIVSGSTIRMWLEAGLLPGELVGGLWVFKREKLYEAFERFCLNTCARIAELRGETPEQPEQPKQSDS